MRFLLALALCIWLPVQGAVMLRLDTNLAPPYQLSHDGRLAGLAVEALQCVMHQLQVGYHMEVVPWRRAKNNVRNGQSDGVFSVMQLPELEPYARLSSPLVLEKWYWFALDSGQLQVENFPASLRIGVLRGSNQQSWLEENGWMPSQTVNHLNSLLRLLAIGRVDVILADQQVIQRQQQLDSSRLSSRFERYVPLGVYFSSRLLAQRPEFLAQFNAQLPACHGAGLTMSESEARQLRLIVDQDVADLLQQPSLQQLLARMPPPDPDWRNRDRVWQQSVKHDDPYPHWMVSLLSSPISQTLAAWQQRHAARYSEIFISSAHGELLATSVVTSDYWQGDEEKVRETLRLAALHPDVESLSWLDGQHEESGGHIDFDDSTHDFIAHLSYPLRYQGKAVAVVTFGVKVESVLRHAGGLIRAGKQNPLAGSIVN